MKEQEKDQEPKLIKKAMQRMVKAKLIEAIEDLQAKLEDKRTEIRELKGDVAMRDNQIEKWEAAGERDREVIRRLEREIERLESADEKIQKAEKMAQKERNKAIRSEREVKQLKNEIEAHEDLTEKLREWEQERKDNQGIHGQATRDLFQNRKHMSRIKIRVAEVAAGLAESNDEKSQQASRLLMGIAGGSQKALAQGDWPDDKKKDEKDDKKKD